MLNELDRVRITRASEAACRRAARAEGEPVMAAHASPRPCVVTGCPALVSGRQSRCADHRLTSPSHGLESRYRWRTFSAFWLRRFPLCGQRLDGQLYPEHSGCVREHRVEPARVCDHITPHRGDVARCYDETGLQSLCYRCHGIKSAAEGYEW